MHAAFHLCLSPTRHPRVHSIIRAHLLALALVTLGVVAWGGAAAEDDFLLPDQAFKVSGESAGTDAVRVRWAIADGYYLYRSKFRFTSKTEGIVVGRPVLPPGETKHDEFFGDVEIFRNQVEALVPLERTTGSDAVLTLETSSQGCADAGLCYPPQRQTVSAHPSPTCGRPAGSGDPRWEAGPRGADPRRAEPGWRAGWHRHLLRARG